MKTEYNNAQHTSKKKHDPRDIVHSGALDGLDDYTVFRRRYAQCIPMQRRLLTDWYIQAANTDERCQIRLVGKYKDHIIRTSPVVSIQSSHRVLTPNCMYVLGERCRVLEHDVQNGLNRLFANGFPANWKTAAEDAFKKTTTKDENAVSPVSYARRNSLAEDENVKNEQDQKMGDQSSERENSAIEGIEDSEDGFEKSFEDYKVIEKGLEEPHKREKEETRKIPCKRENPSVKLSFEGKKPAQDINTKQHARSNSSFSERDQEILDPEEVSDSRANSHEMLDAIGESSRLMIDNTREEQHSSSIKIPRISLCESRNVEVKKSSLKTPKNHLSIGSIENIDGSPKRRKYSLPAATLNKGVPTAAPVTEKAMYETTHDLSTMNEGSSTEENILVDEKGHSLKDADVAKEKDTKRPSTYKEDVNREIINLEDLFDVSRSSDIREPSEQKALPSKTNSREGNSSFDGMLVNNDTACGYSLLNLENASAMRSHHSNENESRRSSLDSEKRSSFEAGNRKPSNQRNSSYMTVDEALKKMPFYKHDLISSRSMDDATAEKTGSQRKNRLHAAVKNNKPKITVKDFLKEMTAYTQEASAIQSDKSMDTANSNIFTSVPFHNGPHGENETLTESLHSVKDTVSEVSMKTRFCAESSTIEGNNPVEPSKEDSILDPASQKQTFSEKTVNEKSSDSFSDSSTHDFNEDLPRLSSTLPCQASADGTNTTFEKKYSLERNTEDDHGHISFDKPSMFPSEGNIGIGHGQDTAPDRNTKACVQEAVNVDSSAADNIKPNFSLLQSKSGLSLTSLAAVQNGGKPTCYSEDGSYVLSGVANKTFGKSGKSSSTSRSRQSLPTAQSTSASRTSIRGQESMQRPSLSKASKNISANASFSGDRNHSAFYGREEMSLSKEKYGNEEQHTEAKVEYGLSNYKDSLTDIASKETIQQPSGSDHQFDTSPKVSFKRIALKETVQQQSGLSHQFDTSSEISSKGIAFKAPRCSSDDEIGIPEKEVASSDESSPKKKKISNGEDSQAQERDFGADNSHTTSAGNAFAPTKKRISINLLTKNNLSEDRQTRPSLSEIPEKKPSLSGRPNERKSSSTEPNILAVSNSTLNAPLKEKRQEEAYTSKAKEGVKKKKRATICRFQRK